MDFYWKNNNKTLNIENFEKHKRYEFFKNEC